MDCSSQGKSQPPTSEQNLDPSLYNESVLLDLLSKLDDFSPVIPTELVDHFFVKAGVQCEDEKLKKLVGLVAQKFISDIASDAIQYNKIRLQTNAPQKDPSKKKERKVTISQEDLIASLSEYGISVKKPGYFL